MAFENIIFEKSDRLARITLNRPERLNAFVGTMREEILAALVECESEDVRAVIITGMGNGFCSGADVKFLAQIRNTGDASSLDCLLQAARNVVKKIRELPKPVIASINGATAGGGINLALACDVRVASERASFGETFIRLGLHPDWGGTFFLPRLIGTAAALEMMMSGDVLSAQGAFGLGLVNRVVPHEDLAAETEKMALRFTRNSPRIIGMIKRAVYMSLDHDFDAMLDYETAAQKECFRLEESAEGLNAFVGKRQPIF